MVNQIPDKGICPEKHRDQGLLLQPVRIAVLSERSQSTHGSGPAGKALSCIRWRWLPRVGPLPYEIRLREARSSTNMQPISCPWRRLCNGPGG
jgi:hypothetical protein